MSRLNRKYIFSKLGLKRSAGPSTTVAEIKQCNPTCSYGARVTKQFNPLSVSYSAVIYLKSFDSRFENVIYDSTVKNQNYISNQTSSNQKAHPKQLQERKY